jgi:hypothetical protein
MGEWKMPYPVFHPWGMQQQQPSHYPPTHSRLFVSPGPPLQHVLSMFNQAVANDVPQQAQKTEIVGRDQHQAHMAENGRLREEMEILKKEHEAKLAQKHLEHDAGHRVLTKKIGTMEAEHGRAMGQHHSDWEAHHTA